MTTQAAKRNYPKHAPRIVLSEGDYVNLIKYSANENCKND